MFKTKMLLSVGLGRQEALMQKSRCRRPSVGSNPGGPSQDDSSRADLDEPPFDDPTLMARLATPNS